MIERRTAAAAELRLRGRRLQGVALRYREPARDRPELFLPGAFAPLPAAVPLNLQHDRDLSLGQAALQDTAADLRMSAELPAGSGVYDLVRRGALAGLSVEFRALADEYDTAGNRVISRARLEGLAVVDEGSYLTELEARARSGRTIRTRIPEGRRLACDCSGQDCDSAMFETGSAAKMLDDAFGRDDPLIAGLGSYQRAFASVERSTIRRTGRTTLEIDVPDDDTGRDVLQLFENVSGAVLVRPYLDARRSTFRKDGSVAVYPVGSAVLRSLILSPTDRVEGWEPPEVIDTPPEVLAEEPPGEPPEGAEEREPEELEAEERRRRVALL